MRISPLKILFLLTGLLSFGNTAVLGWQVTITGRVTDVNTRKPLAGVNLYLSGTTIGTSSDKDGNFLLEVPVQGRFNFIVSFIGYKNFVLPILVKEKATIYDTIELEPDLIVLNEIEVISKERKGWRKAYNDFEKFFLGVDEFAYFTEIKNPEVLDFDFDKYENTYSVTASEPLLVHNNALGYVATVELGEVFFNPKTNGGLYIIFPHFSEMVPPDSIKLKVWEHNRKESYLGSSRHFFRSLIADELETNKFDFLSEENPIKLMQDTTLLKLFFPSDWKYIIDHYSTFRVPERSFQVTRDLTYNSFGKKNKHLVSTVALTGISDLILVDEHGLLYNPTYVRFLGKWEIDRFSRHLPLDAEFIE